MDERTIGVSDELANFVESNRPADESFEAALDRLVVSRAPLSSFSGSWKAVPDAEIEAARSKVRDWRAPDKSQIFDK